MTNLARFVVSILVGGAALLGTEPAAASGPISSADASCRTHLYAGTSKLARGTITRLAKCHSRRLRGQLPPMSTDCNDPANAVGPLHLDRYADSIRDRAARRCEGVASPFSTLGYNGCPQPCDGIAVNSYGDFAECLICFTRATMSDLSADLFGTPSAPADADVRRCQDRIGKAATYMAKRLTVQRRCQLDQDKGDISSMIDCENADPDNRMAAALSKLQGALARCDDASLGSLDSCGATVAAEQACVPPASDTATGDLFDLVYYPGEIILPTSTPTITNTPTITLTPTFTLSPTPTHTFDPNAVEVDIDFLPAGGTAGSCANRVCASGPEMGSPCTSPGQCRACVGGSNMGEICVTNAQCPSSICSPPAACVGMCAGGAYDTLACSNAVDCLGCNPNNICTAASVPLACCTGMDTGTCPVVGSCLILQNPLFAVRLGVNGVCAPRVAPDVFCTTDAECGMGQTCDYGGMTVSLAAPDIGTGEAPRLIQQASFQIGPNVVSGIGVICLSAAADGEGFADCDGGAAGIDSTVSRDHNTTPGDPGNSGSANGLPDDPTCTNSFVLPNGSVSYACLEGTEQCVDGINAGMICTMDGECPGSTCEPCSPGPFHSGVCNSPIHMIESGTFGSGDLAFNLPLELQILGSSGDYGPDNLPCTSDDTPSEPPMPLLLRMSTGTSSGEIFDAANQNGVRVGAGEMCGGNLCVAEVDAGTVSCGDQQIGNVGGLVLGGALTQLDTSAGDLVTTLRLEALP